MTDEQRYPSPPPDDAGMGARPQPEAAPVRGNASRGFAIAGFVLGAVAIFFVPIVLGPVGAILGGVGWRQGDKVGLYAMIFAIVCTIIGLVLGYVAVRELTS